MSSEVVDKNTKTVRLTKIAAEPRPGQLVTTPVRTAEVVAGAASMFYNWIHSLIVNLTISLTHPLKRVLKC